MEGLALILFYISLIGVLVSIGTIIYNVIKKELKHKKKKLFLILAAFIALFIGSTIFYGTVQSPESKAQYEASQKAKEEEKAKKELAEKEKKAEKEKQKEEKATQEEKTKQDVKEETKTEVETKEETSVKTEAKEIPKTEDRFAITSDPNTSAAVDELYYKAKENATTATEEDLKEAIKFIKDNYNNYWVDNETMHKTMYYGSLLECMTKDKAKSDSKSVERIIYDLGSDAVQVTKYIYRKADTIEDDSTKSNLEQIKKGLDSLPDKYKK
ncbi:hypothetical protein [Clostridium neonatale]|uniref:hypothetical protein n=1 Tax=Clostridium neonatale TaxID=137838 RepID=UPI00291B93A3|nr:hypothetical protein [Clostridium neonatale]CAI3193040.1 Cytoskeletal protein RodZ [Clostridium neonatale]CAI3197062.1 Cytoskeletal protein RodZ [Clostridium neonatale]